MVAHIELHLKKEELEKEKYQIKNLSEKLDNVMVFVNQQLPDTITNLEFAEKQLMQEAAQKEYLNVESIRVLQENVVRLKNIYSAINKNRYV